MNFKVCLCLCMSESEAMILCQEICVNQQLKDLGPEVLPSLMHSCPATIVSMCKSIQILNTWVNKAVCKLDNGLSYMIILESISRFIHRLVHAGVQYLETLAHGHHSCSDPFTSDLKSLMGPIL